MEIKTIKTDELTLRYFRFGNEKGQPFIIIPGVALKSVMESAQFIEVQYRRLAEDFDIYVFDRREDMPELYSIYDMADDTIKAIDALGVKNAVIYGVSQGGMIAQTIAVRRPDLVSRLILCSTAAYIPDHSAELLSEWVECAEKHDISRLMKVFAEYVYTEEYFTKYERAFVEFGRLITDEDLRRFAITVRSTGGFDIRAEYGSLKCPVLVIGGDKDKIFSIENITELSELTGGELHIYKGQAHAVYDEESSVMELMKEFALRK